MKFHWFCLIHLPHGPHHQNSLNLPQSLNIFARYKIAPHPPPPWPPPTDTIPKFIKPTTKFCINSTNDTFQNVPFNNSKTSMPPATDTIPKFIKATTKFKYICGTPTSPMASADWRGLKQKFQNYKPKHHQINLQWLYTISKFIQPTTKFTFGLGAFIFSLIFNVRTNGPLNFWFNRSR